MAIVSLKNISKSYDGNSKVVDNISFDIQDKEFVVLVGPSGCGKTTTLRMIAGLEEITDGEISIDDKVVNTLQAKDRDIAMVFQNYALYPHLNVYDNMAFSLKIRKTDKNEIERRVKEAAQILDIEQLLKRKPSALSGGQRQRVAVGRSIVRDPKVFLFDEPLSNLDAKLRVQMRAEISSLHKRLNATMVYVTHDQVEAMTMADKIVVMKDGIIMQIGSPLDLYNNPDNAFVAGFIGSPPMNFITMTVDTSGKKIILDEGDYKLEIPENFRELLIPYNGKKISFGTRPENFTYSENHTENVSITAKVRIVEQLGEEIHLHALTREGGIIAKLPPTLSFDTDETVYLQPDMDMIRLFDTETGAAIR
jgi:multiple sugar transport system ATP-binding protein